MDNFVDKVPLTATLARENAPFGVLHRLGANTNFFINQALINLTGKQKNIFLRALRHAKLCITRVGVAKEQTATGRA